MRTTTPLALVLPLVVSVGGLVWLSVRGISVLDLLVYAGVVAVWGIATRRHRGADSPEASTEFEAPAELEEALESPLGAEAAPQMAPIIVGSASDIADHTGFDIAPLTASLRSGFGATQETMSSAGAEITRCQTLMHESIEGLLLSFSDLKDQSQRQQSLLVDLIRQLSESTEDGSQGVLPRFIAETDVVMRDFVDYIVSVSKQSMAMASRIGDITDQMDRIQSVTVRARQLARSTSLLALNAKIEAAQAGRHAAGFAVIADEVQALAKESHDFNEQISGLVSGVRRTVDETEEAIGGLASRDMNQAIQARSRADGLAREVERLNGYMQTSLREVSQIAGQVDGAVADAVRALQFDDIVRQVLQHSAFILQKGQDLSSEVSRLLEWQDDPADIAARVDETVVEHRNLVEGIDQAVEQESMSEGAIELF